MGDLVWLGFCALGGFFGGALIVEVIRYIKNNK